MDRKFPILNHPSPPAGAYKNCKRSMFDFFSHPQGFKELQTDKFQFFELHTVSFPDFPARRSLQLQIRIFRSFSALRALQKLQAVIFKIFPARRAVLKLQAVNFQNFLARRAVQKQNTDNFITLFAARSALPNLQTFIKNKAPPAGPCKIRKTAI